VFGLMNSSLPRMLRFWKGCLLWVVLSVSRSEKLLVHYFFLGHVWVAEFGFLHLV
jgi:hypothetical protein